MDELTLGLAIAGAAVVGGVVIYNAWQGAKVRRKMPHSVPAELTETLARQEYSEAAPFIEPVRRPAYCPSPHARSEGQPPLRVEPVLGVITPAGTLADLSAEEVTADDGELAVLEQEGEVKPVSAASELSVKRAMLDTAALPVIDSRIDCIVPIRLTAPCFGDKLLPFAQRLRRAGGKPVHIEGKDSTGGWGLLQSGVRYEELRAAAQLANRSGALNEVEFSEFVTGVQQLADAIDGAPEFPDMVETVAMARELDGFAAQCDAQLLIHVLSDSAPWSAHYVQAVASQDGFLLARDGARFVRLDAQQNPTFMLQFGSTNFLRDDLTYKGSDLITLVLDVPVADGKILPFRLMCDYAQSLAERVGAQVVDEQRRPLSDAALLAIEQQLQKLYARLDAAGIPAGSPVTRRLFST